MDIPLTMTQTVIVMLISLDTSRYVRKGAGNPSLFSRKTFRGCHPKYVPDPLHTLYSHLQSFFHLKITQKTGRKQKESEGVGPLFLYWRSVWKRGNNKKLRRR